jgi:hypothetical protein
MELIAASHITIKTGLAQLLPGNGRHLENPKGISLSKIRRGNNEKQKTAERKSQGSKAG